MTRFTVIMLRSNLQKYFNGVGPEIRLFMNDIEKIKLKNNTKSSAGVLKFQCALLKLNCENKMQFEEVDILLFSP